VRVRSVPAVPQGQLSVGLNSMIKHMTKIAPSISLRLVSTRILVKKGLVYYNTPAARDGLIEQASQAHSLNLDLYKASQRTTQTAHFDWRQEPAMPVVKQEVKVKKEDLGDGDKGEVGDVARALPVEPVPLPPRLAASVAIPSTTYLSLSLSRSHSLHFLPCASSRATATCLYNARSLQHARSPKLEHEIWQAQSG
jgi:hypothetical protein